MNILFDTNIILDALLARKPFGEPASRLFAAVEASSLNGFICADSLTTIHYLMRKEKRDSESRRLIHLLLEIFEVAPVNRSVLLDALDADFNDFEDSVVYRSALAVNADGIATRDPKGFRKAQIAVYTPAQLLSILDRQA